MIKLTGHNVGIKPQFYDNKTESGLLYIPEDSIRRANQGTVIYVGDEVKSVSVGDYVLFSGYSGTTVRTDEGVTIIMHEDFLTCKITDDVGEVPGLYLLQNRSSLWEADIYFPAPILTVIELLNKYRPTLDVKVGKPPLDAYNIRSNDAD